MSNSIFRPEPEIDTDPYRPSDQDWLEMCDHFDGCMREEFDALNRELASVNDVEPCYNNPFA